MPEPDNKRLLEEVRKLLAERGPAWDKIEGSRSVMYIPFKESEDVLTVKQTQKGQTTFLAQVESQQDYLTLRSFGKAVQAQLDLAAAGGAGAAEEKKQVTPDNLMESFGALTAEQQAAVLNTTAGKTPLILQHGKLPENLDLKLRPGDSVNVTGHGDKGDTSISSGSGKPSPELEANEVVARLNGDLKRELDHGKPKIKLANCGSAGKFLDAFAGEAAGQGLPGEITVFGYQEDSVAFMDLQYALDYLDKANRFVMKESVAEMSGGPLELTAQWYAGRAELEGLQDDLKALDEQVKVQQQRVDSLPQPSELEAKKLLDLGQQRELAAKAVDAKVQQVDQTHKDLADSFFSQGKKASENRDSVSVRAKLEQMQVRVGQGAGEGSVVHKV